MKKIVFNDNWKFTKKGEAPVMVLLPHDAMQTEKRNRSSGSGSGCSFFEGNHYSYEKSFTASKEWAGGSVWLEIQGVYPDGRVYLNNKEIGYCNYGYINYFFNLEDLREPGVENTLRIETDNTNVPNSRWYSGAGLYRSVNLWTGGKSFIYPQGTRVTTMDIGNIGTDGNRTAKINVKTDFETPGNADGTVYIRITIKYDGREIASGTGSDIEIEIPDAKLWSAESPYLYMCVAELCCGEEVLDISETEFGIRTIEYSTKGLFINGMETLLKGGCIHHDNGILGAREYQVSAYRKIKKLKSYGYNAIRSAHNPASYEILKACDELGMYVMDETWDMWYTPKNKGDYAKHFETYWEKDIEAMVSHDYNHPSVIMYSIGNEVSEPAYEKGIKLAGKLIGKFHESDKTRPVTCGINITILFMHMTGIMNEVNKDSNGNGFSDEQQKISESLKDMDSTKFNEMAGSMGQQMIMAAASDEADKASSALCSMLDISGYNYASSRYGMEGTKHPERIVVGSETYPQHLHDNWEAVKQYPYLIGDFMWTAWDYLGEAGIGSWSYEEDATEFQKQYPWLLADAGALDILGNPTGEAGLAQAVWEAEEEPFIGVVPVNRDPAKLCKAMWRGSNALPYYSYKGCDGKAAAVEVYSYGKTARLFINGKAAGEKELEGHKAVFDIIYEPGELKADILDKDGNVTGTKILKSASGNTEIRILAEDGARPGVPLYIDIDITGSNGEIECNADDVFEVSVSGGELLAFGSANPKTEENFLSGTYRTWYGRAQAVVLPVQEEFEITVSGQKLGTKKAKYHIKQ